MSSMIGQKLESTLETRSYVSINNDKRGTKRLEDRLAITPIVSAAGEKLQLQVIGKSKQPRALKGIDPRRTFGINYSAQPNSWQDGSTFIRDVVFYLNRIAIGRRQKLYRLVGNCSSRTWAAKHLDPGRQSSCDKRIRFSYCPWSRGGLDRLRCPWIFSRQ